MPKQPRAAQERAARKRPATPPIRRQEVIHPECHDDLRFWVTNNPRVARKVLDLMDEVMRTPFSGTGKPEPLKRLGANVWSRRITAEHRLVYVVYDDRVDFLQARYHY